METILTLIYAYFGNTADRVRDIYSLCVSVRKRERKMEREEVKQANANKENKNIVIQISNLLTKI